MELRRHFALFVLFRISLQVNGEGVYMCPESLMQRHDRCYELIVGTYSLKATSYVGSGWTCKLDSAQLGTQLYVPNSDGEFTDVGAYLATKNVTVGVWIGCEEQATNGVFECVDGTQINATNEWWYQPLLSGNIESCAIFAPAYAALLNVSCSGRTRNILCEGPAILRVNSSASPTHAQAITFAKSTAVILKTSDAPPQTTQTTPTFHTTMVQPTTGNTKNTAATSGLTDKINTATAQTTSGMTNVTTTSTNMDTTAMRALSTATDANVGTLTDIMTTTRNTTTMYAVNTSTIINSQTTTSATSDATTTNDINADNTISPTDYSEDTTNPTTTDITSTIDIETSAPTDTDWNNHEAAATTMDAKRNASYITYNFTSSANTEKTNTTTTTTMISTTRSSNPSAVPWGNSVAVSVSHNINWGSHPVRCRKGYILEELTGITSIIQCSRLCLALKGCRSFNIRGNICVLRGR